MPLTHANPVTALARSQNPKEFETREAQARSAAIDALIVLGECLPTAAALSSADNFLLWDVRDTVRMALERLGAWDDARITRSLADRLAAGVVAPGVPV